MAAGNRRNIVVKDQLWGRLQKLAEKEGRGLSELVREALVDLFNKRGRESQTNQHSYDPIKDRFV